MGTANTIGFCAFANARKRSNCRSSQSATILRRQRIVCPGKKANIKLISIPTVATIPTRKTRTTQRLLFMNRAISEFISEWNRSISSGTSVLSTSTLIEFSVQKLLPETMVKRVSVFGSSSGTKIRFEPTKVSTTVRAFGLPSVL